ncbi:HET-domain-containing protein [Annulohypoxylon stygium]|nr:HET-domain-containing protein [Annulohypoxylon stygium]
MDEFQEGIAFWKLPKTFQDAVRVTRSLGLRYLWIDSLCIIQDSDKDWKHQCAIMDDIYSNSYVTLAGTDAKDCDSGFLQDRKPLVEAELPLTYNGKSYTIVFRYWGPRNRCDSTPYRGMPLLRRAWVLQERLLSRRVLYFDPKTMFMECFVNVRREDCSHPMSLYNATTLTRKSRRYDLGRDPKWYWQNLTTTYSSLVLSRVSDKLPALSGIATRFAQVTGFQYLAGIWRQDLPSALAWRVKSSYGIHRKTINEFPSIHPEDSASSYIAPSWSWAAAGETGVEYSLFNPLSIWYEKLKILDCYVSPVDCSAPFGVVNGGWLHVSGKTCQVSVKHTKVSRTRPSGLEILSSTGNECGSFMPDTFAKYDSAVLLYLGRGSRAIYIAHCALAIEPVVDYVDRYRRVGFVQDEKRSGNPNLYDCFQNQKPRRLYLV